MRLPLQLGGFIRFQTAAAATNLFVWKVNFSAIRNENLTAICGRLGGRPKKLDAKKIELAKKLYASKEHTIVEICEAVGVSKATLYKYL